MTAATDEEKTQEQLLREMTPVKINEGGETFYGVSAPPLDNRTFYSRLTLEQKDSVLAGQVSLDSLRVVRDEEAVSGKEILKDMTAFLRKWKPRAISTEEGRRTLAVQLLLDGADPAEIRELVDVNFSVLNSWVHYKNDKGKSVPLDKTVADAIAKAEKAEKAAKAS